MKKKKKVSNIMLVVVCTMIILYAIATFALQYFTSVEVSPTLTTAWFAFWGSEAGFLTCIKISKVIKNTDVTVTSDNIEDEQLIDA